MVASGMASARPCSSSEFSQEPHVAERLVIRLDSAPEKGTERGTVSETTELSSGQPWRRRCASTSHGWWPKGSRRYATASRASVPRPYSHTLQHVPGDTCTSPRARSVAPTPNPLPHPFQCDGASKLEDLTLLNWRGGLPAPIRKTKHMQSHLAAK